MKNPTPTWLWQPPFATHPNPMVRRVWQEFLTYKRGNTYSLGESIEFMQSRMPQRSTSSGISSDIGSSQFRMGYARFMREMRA
jgi:hypothetical protein